jgi:hypothetical protein
MLKYYPVYSMFPLLRNQVEYSETDIGAILNHFVLPPFQRAERELHVQELYHAMKAYYGVHHDIMFTGSISLAKYPDDSDKHTEWCLLDGRHRVRALHLLANEVPDVLTIPIRTDIYTITSEEQKLLLYEIINNTKKVELFSTSTEYETWPAVEKWFKDKFASYWKESANPICLNVNREQIRTRMESLGILKRKHTEVIAELEKMLSYFKAQDVSVWIRWGFKLDDKKLAKLKQDGFYFGIFRNYEWMARMFSDTTDHFSLEEKRKHIPKKMRHDVWDKRFSGKTDGVCFCCDDGITIHQFHCGHIMSVHDGGKNEVSNMEAVCVRCNLDMSTMDMHVYKTKFK